MKHLLCILLIVSSGHIAMAQTWNLAGNSGTTASDFLGTTDSISLLLRTNNLERARLTANGNFLLGTTTNSTYKLDINGGFRSSLNAQINGLVLGRAPGTGGNGSRLIR
jgi:hypothetical protein